MDLDASFLREGIALGIDVIISGFLYKSYASVSSYIGALKKAEQLEIGDLSQLACQKRQRYVCLRGGVGPVDKTMLLRGSDEKNLGLGVIQRIVTKLVFDARIETNVWVEQKKIVKNVQQEVPWGLTSKSMKNGTVVRVIDGLSADRLDMQTVRDQFIPEPFSLSSWCVGWIVGRKLKGTQEVEELLLDGTVLTAVGELVVTKDGSFQLRSPADTKQSLPFILSNLPYISLMNGYEARKSVCKWSLVFFGGIGIYLGYAMLRRWLRARSTRRPNREGDILRDLGNPVDLMTMTKT